MLNMNIDLVVSALKAGNEYEKMLVALDMSTNTEEFLLICLESFKMKETLISDLESAIKGPPASLDVSFVEDIRRIRDGKDGLKALIYSMKHFGIGKVEETMAKVFDITDLKKYKPLIVKFQQWSPQIATLKSKSEKPLKEKKPETVIDFSQFKLVAEMIAKPAITRHQNIEVMALYEQKGNNTLLKKLMSTAVQDVPASHHFEIQDGWSVKNKSTYGGYIKSKKKDYLVDVKKEDVSRRILVYANH